MSTESGAQWVAEMNWANLEIPFRMGMGTVGESQSPYVKIQKMGYVQTRCKFYEFLAGSSWEGSIDQITKDKFNLGEGELTFQL